MSSNESTYTALIAEDEPILADSLIKELSNAWPDLKIGKVVSNGKSALEALHSDRPDVAFLDIRMPGLTGLEVAEMLVEEWDTDAQGTLPMLVFVTAYEEHAIEAFEIQALDYVTKPVTAARLKKTILRIQEQLSRKEQPDLARIAQQLGETLRRPAAAQPLLSTIRASVGNTTLMIPMEDILYFEAADKYVSVISLNGEALIRESLKSLTAQLDSHQFQQIHRSYIVNKNFVLSADKLDDGKLQLNLKDHARKLPVSRVYVHLFKPM